jgi:hypothetical protein
LRWYSLRIILRNAAAANIDELVAAIGGDRFKKPRPAPVGYHTFHLDAGDLQLGKIDGDGVEGTVDRYIAGVDEAVRTLKALRKRKPIGHVHLGWLGDCIEGYVSQGGANAWRTGLPLTDQTRLLRRLMLYTIQSFAPLAEKVTALSVPGNHDEAVRFGGKQVTTFSDSHAVDALYAVGDALQLNTRSYGHVQIIPLKVDDVSITVDLSGTTVVHSHGHMWGRGKHFDWWKGQTFGNHPPAAATIMVTAHEHHAMMDTLGRRTVLRVPALELESTWWKLKTGETGMPGQLVFTTRAGAWSDLAIV